MANEIRVVAIEDHYPTRELLVRELRRRFEGCQVLQIPTESDFIIRFDEMVNFSPHAVVVDLFLRWCEPEEVSSRSQPSDWHFRDAGQRIVRCLCNDVLARDVFILPVSVLGREAVRAEMGSVPKNVCFPDGKGPGEIADLISSLITASPSPAFSREVEPVPPRIEPVPFSEALEAYRSRVEGEKSVRPKLFISYCRGDRDDLERVKKAIRQASRKDPIDVWEDALLTSGEWKPQIEKQMSTATGALFLVTFDFCDSDFIQDVELESFLEAHKRRGVKIMWIAVGASFVDKTPLWNFQCLNKPARPLRSLDRHHRESVLVEIGNKIVHELRQFAHVPR